MDNPRSNEIADLKNFILNLRSGNLLKVIESNQIHFQEKYNTLALRAKQSEDELLRQKMIIKQNTNLIEQFQNQLQELSKENAELVEKQQVLKEENVTLLDQLQSSEEKFAQLDIAYDQQVSLLSEKIQELESQLEALQNVQSEDINQFDQAQAELNEKLSRSEQLNKDLKAQLEALKCQQDDEKVNLRADISALDTANGKLQDKIKKMEEEAEDLQRKLAEAANDSKQKVQVEMEINKLRREMELKQVEYQNEKFGWNRVTDELKGKADELKKRMSSKEKETAELYTKLKELTTFAPTTPDNQSLFGNHSLKQSSTDDPKTLENTSDSDSSSLSVYRPKVKKRKHPSNDEVSLGFLGRKYGFKGPAKSGALKTRTNDESSGIHQIQSFSTFHQHIEIPESPYSPVVSSSALANFDQS